MYIFAQNANPKQITLWLSMICKLSPKPIDGMPLEIRLQW